MYPLKKLEILQFLTLSETIPVIDVRSPSEFNTGHIPGAFNIPLFNDKERETVGIKYKNEGRIEAILKGLELAGPEMKSRLEEALKLAKNRKLLIYCWRGGMRSEAMAWLFSLGDIETEVLENGYKAFRHHVLDSLSGERKIVILGGLTGSGKTMLLKYIKTKGHQVIDLEGIACHKGSAFGALGQASQPSSEHFANLLFDEIVKTDKEKTLWLEDESKSIGSVYMPDKFYFNMQDSPVIALIIDREVRLPRLLEEYSKYPEEEIKSSITRISKRLGGDKTKEALSAVDKNDFSTAIRITLEYYDKAYMFGLKRRPESNIIYIESDTADLNTNALKIIEAASSFQ